MTDTEIPRPTVADEVDAFFSLEPDVIQRPHQVFRRLRQECPVYHDANRVLVTRHDDARQVLTAPTTHQGLSVDGVRFRRAMEQSDPVRQRQLLAMFEFYEKRVGGTNGDRHARLRRLTLRAFTPRVVAQMEERITELTRNLIAPLLGREEIDMVGDFAYHLPLMVMCEMLDVPVEDRESLHEWSNDLGEFVGVDWGTTDRIERLHDSLFKLRAYLGGVFASRRGRPTTELLAAMLAAEGEGEDSFTEDELVATITQFIFAGHETTTNLIASSMLLLLGEHRDQWQLLCDDPSLIPNAVEEVLRYEPPTLMIEKIAASPCRVAGTDVDRGESVSVVLASANRDAAVVDDPDRFDITRSNVAHLSFGFGPHFCLGASLARLEGAVVLREFTRRFPEMRLAGDEVSWRPNHMIHGLRRLPVVLGPERQ
jgi:cytochrome P450